MRHPARRPLGLAVALTTTLTLLASSSGAMAATTAVVPDDYSTIQAALDAQPDSVIVRSGVAPEAIVISNSVVLTAWTRDLPGGDAVPRLTALAVVGPEGDGSGIVVEGFHVLGPVRLAPAAAGYTPPYFSVRFQTCRMDSGLTQSAPAGEVLALRIRGCTIFGSVDVRCSSLDFSLNTLVGGGLGGNVPGGGIVQSNLIQGPAAAAVQVNSDGGFATRWNVIRGTQNGILTPVQSASRVEGNRIEDCPGTAVVARSVYGGGEIVGNIVRRCGTGLDITSFRGPQSIAQNDVRDCAAIGIRVASDRNTPTVVAGNVVAGCGGAGFDVRGRGIMVSGNTSALNDGSGFVLSEVASVDHDLGFENQGYGVEWLDASTPPLSCNDWFANAAGAVSTGNPGASDLAVDPIFCDATQGDFRLAPTSPVGDPVGCGLMGALGVGCGDAPTPVLVSEFDAEAGVDGIELRWRWLGATTPAAVTLERAPAAAGPWQALDSGVTTGDGLFESVDTDVREGSAYYYRLRIVLAGGASVFYGPRVVVAGAVGDLRLDAASANPARGPVRLDFALPRDESVRITVHDVQGREVATLFDGTERRGWHRVEWDGGSANGRSESGVYFVRMVAGTRVLSRTITLTK